MIEFSMQPSQNPSMVPDLSNKRFPTSSNLQQVTDNGATTTNSIVSTNAPTFTYTDEVLTNITYSNTLEKDLVYNPDGTLDTLTITMPDSTVITKSFVWSSGVLQSIIIT